MTKDNILNNPDHDLKRLCNCDGSWHLSIPDGNSSIAIDLDDDVKSLISDAERRARENEMHLWVDMVVRNDHSRFDSNEWYKLNPRDVAKFLADRIKSLNNKGTE